MLLFSNQKQYFITPIIFVAGIKKSKKQDGVARHVRGEQIIRAVMAAVYLLLSTFIYAGREFI